jgi:ATP-dependent protease ClpP protease subunit
MSEHYLYMSCAIDERVQNQFIAYLVELANDGATKLTIAMNSPGGGVVAGNAMYNTLASMPFHVCTHNIGNTDSIANVIFLAGKERYANPTATFMFHGVSFDGNANERLEEKNLLEKLDTIKVEHKRIASLIEAHSSLTAEACVKLFESQSTKDATWAKSNGFISEITNFVLPAGASTRYLI